MLRGRKGRAFFVLAAALYLGAFAVYLKASAVEPVHAATSSVKIWADPNSNRVVDHKASISPAPLLLFFLLFTLVLNLVQSRRYDHFFAFPFLPVSELFCQSPNWLRPPPSCGA